MPKDLKFEITQKCFFDVEIDDNKMGRIACNPEHLLRIAVHRDKLLRHSPSSCAEVFGLYGDVMPRTVGLLIQSKCRQGKKCLQDFARNYVQQYSVLDIYIYIYVYIFTKIQHLLPSAMYVL